MVVGQGLPLSGENNVGHGPQLQVGECERENKDTQLLTSSPVAESREAMIPESAQRRRRIPPPFWLRHRLRTCRGQKVAENDQYTLMSQRPAPRALLQGLLDERPFSVDVSRSKALGIVRLVLAHLSPADLENANLRQKYSRLENKKIPLASASLCSSLNLNSILFNKCHDNKFLEDFHCIR